MTVRGRNIFIGAPSWVMAPGGVLPILDVWPEQGLYYPAGIENQITCARALVKWLPNAAGVLAPIPVNGVPLLPGFGWLSEAARQNVLLQSRALATAPWSKGGIAVATNNALTGPDGVANSASQITVGVFAGDTVFQSIAGLSAGRHEPSFSLNKLSATGILEIRNRLDGTNGFWSIALASIPAGWQRITRNTPGVTITNEFNVTATAIGLDFACPSGGPITVGIDFVNMEPGAYSTSPIVTAAAAVTRPTDIISGSLLARELARGAAGWVYGSAGYIQQPNVAGGYLVGSQIAGTPVPIYPAGPTNANMFWRTWNGATNLPNTDGGVSIVNAYSHGVYTWDASGRLLVSNGGTPATDAGATGGALITQIVYGNDGAGDAPFGGVIRRVVWGNSRLTTNDAKALSARAA